ncbi:unnamed protein product [Orchesella dallaii]|uniref:Uncharacterized protein n=1 Tax=Orchesella dallaii TaxID=48710 RepID=A0ABP1S819_9HEXA
MGSCLSKFCSFCCPCCCSRDHRQPQPQEENIRMRNINTRNSPINKNLDRSPPRPSTSSPTPIEAKFKDEEDDYTQSKLRRHSAIKIKTFCPPMRFEIPRTGDYYGEPPSPPYMPANRLLTQVN